MRSIPGGMYKLMQRWHMFAVLLLMPGISLPVLAVSELEPFEDPHKQSLYVQLTKELRCLVCQNQNLADSNADLARDLRKKTWEMVNTGMQYDEIVAFMVNRYGDFVLYRPPLKSTTLILWTAPFLLGSGLLLYVIRNRKRTDKLKQSSRTPAEMLKAKTLIDQSREDA